MRHLGSARRIAAGISVAWLLLTAAPPAFGGLGFTTSLPVPPKKPVNGLSLVFDCTWAESSGYLPMRVKVFCTPAAPVARRLEIEITNRTLGQRRPVTVTADVEIPAGAVSVTKVVPFPNPSRNIGGITLNVWEYGVFLKDLSFENMSLFNSGVGQGTVPATLFVTDAQIDVSQFEFVADSLAYMNNFNMPNMGTRPSTGSVSISQIAPFASLPAGDLFENWINYSGLDVIFIAASDIESLAANRPRVLAALRDWTMAGGNLCVYGVGESWDGLAALEGKLRWPADAAQAEQPRRGWSVPESTLYNMDLQQPGGAIVVRDESDVDVKAVTTPKKPPQEPPFVWKRAGLGMVVAIAKADPFPGDSINWRWLFNTIDPSRWQWESRHGLSISEGNASFDDFTIADVGLPPVKSYRVLITLFVVAIGPVNYWLLRRKGRLHLLLFTVPAAAIVVSLGLLAYALVADGFDTYFRARSYTELDQRRGEAVSWSRLSYYAGLAPSGGLQFGVDTAVLPIERDSYWRRSMYALKQTDWTVGQHLVRGWLTSRTPTQYLTVRPYACQRALRVLESSGQDGCAVDNRLDTNIKFVMLRTAGGDLCFGRDIDDAGHATLELLDTDEKAQQAALDMLGERSRATLDSASTYSKAPSSIFAPSPMVRNQRFGGEGYYDRASLLESGLTDAFSAVNSHLAEPRTYVAIVERPPDVSAGMDGLVERQSLHVIRGSW